MAANDGEHPVTSNFGFALPQGTGAPGSMGATHADTAPDTGLSTQITSVYESVQNRPVPMVGVEFDDTAVPGQNREGISGLGASFIADTGAGHGGNVMQGHHPNAGTQ